jgi:glycosyltransferase involved in cell wall biosynthesis
MISEMGSVRYTEVQTLSVETDVNADLAALAKRVSGVAILLDASPRTWTSVEEINYRLSRKLCAQGINVVLVYAGLAPEHRQRFEEVGARVEIVGYGKQRYRYFRELGRIFRENSISLVHVCFFDYFSLIPWLARLNGVSAIIYEELNSGMINATGWKRKLLQLRTAVTGWPMSRVIAVSEFVKNDLVKRGFAPEDIVVRYLAADEEKFKPDPDARKKWTEEYSIAPDELIMSSVTLFRPFKSPETLVEMTALLAQRSVSARLFMAGDGSMLNDLKELGEKLRVSDRIHWLGFCNDPRSLMQASDVFLLASVGEAGGFVLSEAMGCGTPIVGSASGVIAECVDNGKTGFLAIPKDASSFADAVEKLARDRSLLQSMRVRSRERMLKYFTVDIHVDSTIGVYASVQR